MLAYQNAIREDGILGSKEDSMVALQPQGRAPYTTASSITTVMDAYRDRGLGVPVTADVITRAGVGETIANRTLDSLKTLGLLNDDNTPSEQFQDMRQIRGEDEYKARVQEWLRGVYADVLQYTDPSTDGSTKVAEAFRTYEPAGRRNQMAALLIGLWRYAGLPVVDSPGPAPGRSVPRAKKATAAGPPAGQRRAAERPPSGGSSIPDGLPPGLVGLLQQVPTNGTGWTADRRQTFLTAFTAVLDFTVPVEESAKSEGAQGVSTP